MFPVPRMASEMELEWAAELSAHFGCDAATFRTKPTSHMSFPHEAVRLELMDGSHAQFKNAFFIASEAKKAIAVFTEHCGHHVFPFHEARVYCNGELRYEQRA